MAEPAIPSDCRFTRDHAWVWVNDGLGTVGISHYAQEQLGDIVYISLPSVGASVEQLEKMGEVESVKAVSDLFSPVSGRVMAVNQELSDHPELVNQDPYGQGWLIKVELSEAGELEDLLTADEYLALIAAPEEGG